MHNNLVHIDIGITYLVKAKCQYLSVVYNLIFSSTPVIWLFGGMGPTQTFSTLKLLEMVRQVALAQRGQLGLILWLQESCQKL